MSRSRSSTDRLGILNVRMMRSCELTSRSRPEPVIRRVVMIPEQTFSEYMISRVLVSMMLILPLLVPAMMWSPVAVQMADVVFSLGVFLGLLLLLRGVAVGVCALRDGREHVLDVDRLAHVHQNRLLFKQRRNQL